MKKLTGPAQLRKGRIYNRVYVGNNQAYAKINGKETFLVLQTKPNLQVVELFDQFGSPYEKNIPSSVITYEMPEVAFKDFEIFEPTKESEWFKKSVVVKSLVTALKRKYVTLGGLKKLADWHGMCPFVASMGRNMKLVGVHCHFCVEGKTKDLLLQTVFVVWKDWSRMQADFKKVGIPKVRT